MNKEQVKEIVDHWRSLLSDEIFKLNHHYGLSSAEENSVLGTHGVLSFDQVDRKLIHDSGRYVYLVHLRNLNIYFFTDNINPFEHILSAVKNVAVRISYPYVFTQDGLKIAANTKEFLELSKLEGEIAESTEALFELIYQEMK